MTEQDKPHQAHSAEKKALDEQLNNPLHGLKLETLVTELVDHYGFEILAEYTNLNCFKNKPSIESTVKFLRKTQWACEKMEIFYLYKFKRLPKADDENYELPPRKRLVPLHQKPRTPMVLELGKAPKPDANKNSSNRRSSNREEQNSGAYANKSRTASPYDSKTSRTSHSKREGKRNDGQRKTQNKPSDDPWAFFKE